MLQNSWWDTLLKREVDVSVFFWSRYILVLTRSLSRMVWSPLSDGYTKDFVPIHSRSIHCRSAEILFKCVLVCVRLPRSSSFNCSTCGRLSSVSLGQSDCLQETLSSRLSLLIKWQRRPSMLFKGGSPSRRCEVEGAGFTRAAGNTVMWARRYLVFN